ncbi:glycosyl transferase family 2, partial [Halobacteriales archaeon QS_9_70_65]
MSSLEAGAADADSANANADGPFTFDDLSVVMGTYNEEAAVGTVLDDIKRVTDGRAE